MAWIDTDHAVTQILNRLQDGTGGTFPTVWWASLFTTTPNSAGAGGVELLTATHAWYARKGITWNEPVSRAMANSNAVEFASSAGTAVPNPVLSMGIHDASTGGNLWHILILSSPMTIGVGSLVNFPIGQIVQEFNT